MVNVFILILVNILVYISLHYLKDYSKNSSWKYVTIIVLLCKRNVYRVLLFSLKATKCLIIEYTIITHLKTRKSHRCRGPWFRSLNHSRLQSSLDYHVLHTSSSAHLRAEIQILKHQKINRKEKKGRKRLKYLVSR